MSPCIANRNRMIGEYSQFFFKKKNFLCKLIAQHIRASNQFSIQRASKIHKNRHSWNLKLISLLLVWFPTCLHSQLNLLFSNRERIKRKSLRDNNSFSRKKFYFLFLCNRTNTRNTARFYRVCIMVEWTLILLKACGWHRVHRKRKVRKAWHPHFLNLLRIRPKNR